jgi:DNA mismatch endonuclease (patch repair protein)
VAIFVHGCFWHRHSECKYATVPKTNTAFWRDKFSKNEARDAEAVRNLRRMKYRVFTIWDCQLRTTASFSRIASRMRSIFSQDRTKSYK